MNKNHFPSLFIFIFWLGVTDVAAQNVTILPSGITPALSSTHPRLTYDAILALPSPVEGDIVYDTMFKCLRVFNGSKWVCTNDPAQTTPNMAAIASAGGTSVDVGNGIVVDAAGNVYVAGHYSGTASFGGINITSAGNYDVFVAKYNSSGTIQWVRSAGGTGFDSGTGIALDAAGNVYVTGLYSGTASFGGSNITSAGNYDVFVAKYNSSGTLQWVRSAGGTSVDFGRGITLDATGNVYVTGYYAGTASFGGISRTSAGNYDVFVAKYNSSGTILWVQSAGGAGFDEGKGIALDAAGNVHVTGYYQGTASFGGINITSAGGYDVFVAKYNSSGTILWVRSAGGTLTDESDGIALDAAGNVYMTGNYQGTANFGGISSTSVGNSDVFVAKYNSSGTILWVRSAGGIEYDLDGDIALDAAGNVYVTGHYQGTASFGGISSTSAGILDVFVAKYNSSGTIQWVQSAGGILTDESHSIALDAAGNVYVTGYYQDTASFGGISKTSAGSSDVFVARLDK
jgi:uncharacterized protein (AIM24 family)